MSSRRKNKARKKHQAQVVAFQSRQYNQAESGIAPKVTHDSVALPGRPGPASPATNSERTAGHGGSLTVIRGPGQEPNSLPRQVPVYGPGDSGDSQLFTVSENFARTLLSEGKVTVVQVARHAYGLQIVPPPPPEIRKVVVMRGRDCLKPHHNDTLDNPEGCWTFGSLGEPGPRAPNGKRGEKVAATFRERNFHALPRGVDRSLFEVVIRSVLPNPPCIRKAA